MWACARWCWGCGDLPLRSGILLRLIPPFILALPLMVIGPLLPAARGEGVVEPQEFAFSVISIEPERNPRPRGSPSLRPGLQEEDAERKEGEQAYEDENEMHSRQVAYFTSVFFNCWLLCRLLLPHYLI